jgi:Inner centromere protein, ARK binding region
VTSAKSALTITKEYASNLSSLTATAATSSTKKNALTTQMREKAAAAAAAAMSSKKENAPTMSKSTVASAGKRHLPLHTNSRPDPLGATLKQQPSILKKPRDVQSPVDTYEISDREDSETDDSDSEAENDKQKKKIPTWASRANLVPALEQQYNGCIDGKKVDPDTIFPEVQSCDLEAIFENKKSKYRSRTSSGNWARDKVTAAEKLVYKRDMGFATDVEISEI